MIIPPIIPWWLYLRREDLPEINIGGIEAIGACIAWVLATLIFILMNHFLFSLKVKGYITFDTHMWLSIPVTLIYAFLIIVFIKASFRIVDAIEKRKNNDKRR